MAPAANTTHGHHHRHLLLTVFLLILGLAVFCVHHATITDNSLRLLNLRVGLDIPILSVNISAIQSPVAIEDPTTGGSTTNLDGPSCSVAFDHILDGFDHTTTTSRLASSSQSLRPSSPNSPGPSDPNTSAFKFSTPSAHSACLDSGSEEKIKAQILERIRTFGRGVE